MEESIRSVYILAGQISFVITNIGSYVVSGIPMFSDDDNSWQNNILIKADTIDEAKLWVNKHYGLK
jgi:hypothetical protein